MAQGNAAPKTPRAPKPTEKNLRVNTWGLLFGGLRKRGVFVGPWMQDGDGGQLLLLGLLSITYNCAPQTWSVESASKGSSLFLATTWQQYTLLFAPGTWTTCFGGDKFDKKRKKWESIKSCCHFYITILLENHCHWWHISLHCEAGISCTNVSKAIKQGLTHISDFFSKSWHTKCMKLHKNGWCDICLTPLIMIYDGKIIDFCFNTAAGLCCRTISRDFSLNSVRILFTAITIHTMVVHSWYKLPLSYSFWKYWSCSLPSTCTYFDRAVLAYKISPRLTHFKLHVEYLRVCTLWVSHTKSSKNLQEVWLPGVRQG